MKKNLALIGSSVLLASCGATVSVGAPGPTPASITNSSLAVASNFTLAEDFTHQGVTYFAGTPVICTNLDTALGFAFDYTGELDTYRAELVNVNTSTVIAAETFTETQNDGEVVQAGFFNTGTATTLSKTFKPQAIIVVPTDPQVEAVVRLRVQASTDGTVTDVATSRRFLMISNCPAPQQL